MDVSQNFKNKIKTAGRQLDLRIKYKLYGNLKSEDNHLLLTEDNLQLMTEANNESSLYDNTLSNDEVISLKKNNLGELFRTYMKSFDLETYHDFVVGQAMTIELGVKLETDTEYEYINYGTYFVYEKEYNEDTKSYHYVLCDDMLRTMIPFKIEYLFNTGETQVTIANAIRRILEACGFPDVYYGGEGVVGGPYSINLGRAGMGLLNYNKVIYKETFDGLDITCRDVLDMIMQCTMSSLVVNDLTGAYEGKLQYTYKLIGFANVDVLDEDVIIDNNIKFVERFGPVNSLLLTRADGNDNIERKDNTSIEENGVCQYKVENNLILEQSNRDDFIDNMFNYIDGLSYYVCDFDCIGLGYIEYLNRFEVDVNGNNYGCICLKNTFNLSNGLDENFTSEVPQEKTVEYTNGGLDDKKASIMMDKINGTLVLKTYQDGGKTKVASVRLDSSGDSGSDVTISADNIALEGYTTINGTFSVDLNGNMSCSNATITGGMVHIIGDSSSSIWIREQGTNNYAYMYPTQTDITNGYESCVCSPDNIQLWTTRNNKVIDLSLNPYGTPELYVTDGTSTSYMTPTSVVPGSSLIETKKNVKDDVKGLDIIKDIDIYSYNYKSEEDNSKKHIGFIIGKDYNYSSDVTAIDKDGKEIGADIYSFVSVCCKAIKEQQEEIEQLRKELEEVKNDRS